MKLKYAKIVNFRSIQNAQISFDPMCRILVGINESGKSNILQALSMIGEDFTPTPEDVREPLPKEKSVDESYIWFVFTLDKSEVEQVYTELKSKILAKKIGVSLFKTSAKEITLKDFCYRKNEGLYNVNVITQEKSGSHWAIDAGYELLSNWKKPSSTCPTDFQVQFDSKQVLLKKYSLINVSEYPDIPEDYLEDTDAKYINQLVGSEISTLITDNLPEVIFWKYDEENLLPPSVNIDAFIANPDSCIPLKNMFTLSGIEDIATEITKARTQSTNKLRNLLRRVSTYATNHFQNVWKEYKEIKFALEPNGGTIEANIVEKNYWRLSQRSDGLKRFTTFLLHISANVKANLINNAILLVDEPDMGLHPSGSRYLRDELIDIGKKNYVVFSTHSIFMIDKDTINRHIIVKKEKEKTNITNANESNFVDEEVLFNALHYTVFDILKKDNIIFEGWRDKKLFQTAVSKIPKAYSSDLKSLKDKLKKVGLCHAEGVKDVRNITPLIELAGRNCFILSDSDKPAKEKQEEYQKIRGYGVWKRYDEISNRTKAETGEDFIKEDAFKSHLNKIKQKYPNITGDPTLGSWGRMEETKKWLLTQGLKQDQVKEILNSLKESIFDDLKPSDVDTSYYGFLKDFINALDSSLK
jgi:predicted ATPase